MNRVQLPPTPDHHLRGFVGGFAAGDYAYFVPSFNGDFFGKVPRLNMKTGTLQFIDMQQDGRGLAGFSSGFTHRDRQICYNRIQMGHRKDVGAEYTGISYRGTKKNREDFYNACGSLPSPDISFLQQIAVQKVSMPYWAVAVMDIAEWTNFVTKQATEADRLYGNVAITEGLYSGDICCLLW